MQIEDKFSTWQQKKVPTYQVTKAHGSLVEIIGKVPPYSRLELCTGTYTDPLLFLKPIEIVASEAEAPEIVARGPCITITNNISVYMEGITITAKMLNSVKKDKEVPAVLVAAGSSEFFRCIMSSMIISGDATPKVTECVITKAPIGSGVVFQDNGGGIFFNTDIRDHPGYCLEIHGSCTAQFRGCTIRSSQDNLKVVLISGSVVDDGSKCAPYFENNVIGSGNVTATDADPPPLTQDLHLLMHLPHETLGLENAAVMLANRCSPTFTVNRITGGKIGIMIGRGVKAVFQNDRIDHFQLWGVFCTPMAECDMSELNMSYCGGGIRVEECTRLLKFTQVHVHHCQTNAVQLNKGADALFSDCTFSANLRGGVSAGPGCGCLFEEGTISRNEDYGIVTYGPLSKPHFKETRILCNRTGVLVTRSSAPLLEGCVVNLNKKHGVFSSKGCHAMLTKCHITQSAVHNVVFTERSKGEVISCDISEAGEWGVVIRDGSNPVIKSCAISKNRLGGFLCSDGGIGYIEKNEIGLMPHAVVVETFADPIVLTNKIRNCSLAGVVFREEGLGTLLENEIFSCLNNIVVQSDSEPVIRKNRIYQAEAVGILCERRAFPLIEYNTIYKCTTANITCTGDACEPIIIGNEITDSIKYGLLCTNSAKGHFERNLFSRNAEGGMCCTKKGNGEFVGNTSKEEGGPAMLIMDEGLGLFMQNTVSVSSSAGIRIHNGAPNVNMCTLTKCQEGLELLEGAKGTVTSCTFTENAFGATVKASIKLVIDRCQFSENTQAGVLFEPNASCGILNCDFMHNQIGVDVREATPDVNQSTFRCNDVSCTIVGVGKGSFISCSFESAQSCHVQLLDAGTASFLSCTFKESPEGVVCQNGGGMLQKCSFSKHGIALKTSQEGTLQVLECSVTDNRIGLWALSKSTPTVQSTEFSTNGEMGVLSEDDADPVLRSCLVTGTPHGIVVRNDGRGRFAELTITKNDVGVHIASDKISKLSDSHIQENRSHGVKCTDHAACAIDHNIFQSNKKSGIFIQGISDDVLITNNDINSNMEYGICASVDSTCLISKNTFANNMPCSVLLENSKAIVQQNEFSHGSDGLTLVFTSGDVQRNVFRRHTGSSVVVQGTCDATFEDNVISDNATAILFHPSSRIRVAKNTFRQNTSGCVIQKNAEPQLEENVFETGMTGISLCPGAGGSIVSNRFHETTRGVVTDGSGITTKVSSNTFTACTESAILVRQGTDSFCIERNRFSKNQVGIVFSHKSDSRAKENTFLEGNIGINIDGASCALEDNLFNSCDIGVNIQTILSAPVLAAGNVFKHCLVGVLSINSGGSMIRCTFEGSNKAGLVFEEAGTFVASKCLFFDHSTAVPAVLFTNNASGTLQSCDLHGNDVSVLVEKHSKGLIEKNVFHHNREHAIVLKQNSSPRIEGNVFILNGTSDVLVSDGSNPTLAKNLFEYNDCGVLVEDKAVCTIEENVFHFCFMGIFALCTGLGTIVRSNLITECITGLIAQSHATLDICNNTFDGCNAGLEVSKLGAPNVSKNIFRETSECIVIFGQGRGVYSQNLIVNCTRCGFQVSDNSDPMIEQNCIADSRLAATYHGSGTSGVFAKNAIHKCQHGLVFGSKICPVVTGNVIFNNESGVNIHEGSLVKFTENVVHGNQRYGVQLDSDEAIVQNNSLFSTLESGAYENKRSSTASNNNNNVRNRFSPANFNHVCVEIPSLPRGVAIGAKRTDRTKMISESCHSKDCSLVDPQWEEEARKYIGMRTSTGAGRRISRGVLNVDMPSRGGRRRSSAVPGSHRASHVEGEGRAFHELLSLSFKRQGPKIVKVEEIPLPDSPSLTTNTDVSPPQSPRNSKTTVSKVVAKVMKKKVKKAPPVPPMTQEVVSTTSPSGTNLSTPVTHNAWNGVLFDSYTPRDRTISPIASPMTPTSPMSHRSFDITGSEPPLSPRRSGGAKHRWKKALDNMKKKETTTPTPTTPPALPRISPAEDHTPTSPKSPKSPKSPRSPLQSPENINRKKTAVPNEFFEITNSPPLNLLPPDPVIEHATPQPAPPPPTTTPRGRSSPYASMFINGISPTLRKLLNITDDFQAPPDAMIRNATGVSIKNLMLHPPKPVNATTKRKNDHEMKMRQLGLPIKSSVHSTVTVPTSGHSPTQRRSPPREALKQNRYGPSAQSLTASGLMTQYLPIQQGVEGFPGYRTVGSLEEFVKVEKLLISPSRPQTAAISSEAKQKHVRVQSASYKLDKAGDSSTANLNNDSDTMLSSILGGTPPKTKSSNVVVGWYYEEGAVWKFKPALQNNM